MKKNQLAFIYSILLMLFLTSCAKFSDGKSVFSEGLWIIGVLLALGGSALIIASYVGSRSGSWQWVGLGTPDVHMVEDDKNVSIFSNKMFWGGVILFAFLVFFIVYQNSQK